MPAIGKVSTSLEADMVIHLVGQPKPTPTAVHRALARFGVRGVSKGGGSWEVSGDFQAVAKINGFLEEKMGTPAKRGRGRPPGSSKKITVDSKKEGAEPEQGDSPRRGRPRKKVESDIEEAKAEDLKPQSPKASTATDVLSPRRSGRRPVQKRKLDDYVYDLPKKSKISDAETSEEEESTAEVVAKKNPAVLPTPGKRGRPKGSVKGAASNERPADRMSLRRRQSTDLKETVYKEQAADKKKKLQSVETVEPSVSKKEPEVSVKSNLSRTIAGNKSTKYVETSNSGSEDDFRIFAQPVEIISDSKVIDLKEGEIQLQQPVEIVPPKVSTDEGKNESLDSLSQKHDNTAKSLVVETTVRKETTVHPETSTVTDVTPQQDKNSSVESGSKEIRPPDTIRQILTNIPPAHNKSQMVAKSPVQQKSILVTPAKKVEGSAVYVKGKAETLPRVITKSTRLVSYSLEDFRAGRDPDQGHAVVVTTSSVATDVPAVVKVDVNSSKPADDVIGMRSTIDDIEKYVVPESRPRKEVRKIALPVQDEKGNYNCLVKECGFKTTERATMRTHMLRFHLPYEYECEYCHKSFGILSDLRKHLKVVHGGTIECNICGKTYKSEVTLARHLRTHESNYEKTKYPCYRCKKEFASQYYLVKHLKFEHEGVDRPQFLCTYCGAVFTQKGHMLEHTNVHTGKKPYKCSQCDKAFMYSASLRVHRAIHSDERNHICEECNARFKTRQGLLMHMDMHKEHKYRCAYCDKTFWQKGGLVRHTRVHLGLKPFICTICGNSFSDPSILRRHLLHKHKLPKDNLSQFMSIALSASKRLAGEFNPETLEKIHEMVKNGEIPKIPPKAGTDGEGATLVLVTNDGVPVNLGNAKKETSGETVYELRLEDAETVLGPELAAAVSIQVKQEKETDDEPTTNETEGKSDEHTTDHAEEDKRDKQESVIAQVLNVDTTPVTAPKSDGETTTQLTIATPQGETLLVIQGAPHEIDLPRVLQSLDIILQPDGESTVKEEEVVVVKQDQTTEEQEAATDEQPELQVILQEEEEENQASQASAAVAEQSSQASIVELEVGVGEKGEIVILKEENRELEFDSRKGRVVLQQLEETQRAGLDGSRAEAVEVCPGVESEEAQIDEARQAVDGLESSEVSDPENIVEAEVVYPQVTGESS